MRFQGFVGPSYQLQSKNFDRQRCINLYAVLHEFGTGKEKEVGMLVGTPGLRTLTTLAAGRTRGGYKSSKNDRAFVVAGNKLYEITKSGSTWSGTERGTLNSSTGPVSMSDNGIQMMIVDGGNGYSFTFGSNTFAQIVDVDFPGADMVDYMDGYLIFNRPNTGQYGITDINGISIDGLDFSTAEGNPDNLVGLLVDNGELWLFGEYTIEIHFNSGNADFPFERVSGGRISIGCLAPFSIARMNNARYWLGRNEGGFGIIYEATSTTPKRISTHAVELAIQSYSDVSDARAYTYQQNGHNFYVLNFPTANTTWVYDSTTGLWHERAYTNDGTLERHRGDWHMVAFSAHVVGDYETGKIYELSHDVYEDDGAVLTRKRITPHVSSGGVRLQYNSLQLDIETGVGLDGIQQGTDPQVMMQFSDDGGHSWSHEKWTGFGKIGARLKRAIWRRMGVSRDRVYSVTITDPVPVRIIGAEIEIERLAS